VGAAARARAGHLNGARPSGPPAGAIAVLLWAALLLGVVIGTGLCVYLHPRFVPLHHPVNTTTLVAAALVLAGLAASAVLPLLRRIEPRGRDEDIGQWWARMLPRALAVWAVGDVVGMFGAVACLLTGKVAVFAVSAVAVAIFVLTNPARLQDR
jgi:hypothetical protein